jgi:hypothetical protein
LIKNKTICWLIILLHFSLFFNRFSLQGIAVQL